MILRQAARSRMPVRSMGAGFSRLGGVRTIMEPTEIKYTASAKASKGGRAGTVSVASAVAPLSAPIPLALPKSMGGTGEGVNPEQLFSAGYAACYLSALHACARKAGKKIDGAEVEVKTSIGPTEEPGFALVVEMLVKGVNDQSIVDAAHKMCPYSRALKHGIKSTTKLV